jgi:hypothetical protein
MLAKKTILNYFFVTVWKRVEQISLFSLVMPPQASHLHSQTPYTSNPSGEKINKQGYVVVYTAKSLHIVPCTFLLDSILLKRNVWSACTLLGDPFQFDFKMPQQNRIQ